MAQFARPDSTVTASNVTGGFSAIDEAVASDADFAWSANNTTAELEVGLSDVSDPAAGSGHVVRYRYAKTNNGTPDSGGNNGTLEVRLLQGSTLVATSGSIAVSSATWTAGNFTLAAIEADAITDYTDLRLEFVLVGGGGSPSVRRGVGVSWVELEVPDAAPPVVSLAGPGAGVAAGAGLLAVAVPLIGTGSASSVGTGSLTVDAGVEVALAGMGAGVSVGAGILLVAVPLLGTGTVTSSGSGIIRFSVIGEAARPNRIINYRNKHIALRITRRR
jgi:hypothetical protein